MTAKKEIEKMIHDNMRQKLRDPDNTLDSLDFLSIKVTESPLFELKEPIVLKNSWKKKIGNHLVLAVTCGFMVYGIFHYSAMDQWWHWSILILMIMAMGSFLFRFMENDVMIKISNRGLTFDNDIYYSWDQIEYLYFKTRYDGEGSFDGTFLVERLKSGTEFEVLVSELSWSTDKLGRLLYRCMKRYAS